jgi:hypothetical protein
MCNSLKKKKKRQLELLAQENSSLETTGKGKNRTGGYGGSNNFKKEPCNRRCQGHRPGRR